MGESKGERRGEVLEAAVENERHHEVPQRHVVREQSHDGHALQLVQRVLGGRPCRTRGRVRVWLLAQSLAPRTRRGTHRAARRG